MPSADANADDENAKQVIGNIEGMVRRACTETEKEILLLAISKRSQFTFDMIHWISRVTSILLAVSNAPACDEHNRDELRKHAQWLVWVLSFVPDDIDTVQFIESFGMTETIFDVALDAHRRELPDIATDIMGLLIWWMYRGGQYQSGWAILEHSVYGAAVLALLTEAGGGVDKLKRDIVKRLAEGGLPAAGSPGSRGAEIRGHATSLRREGRWRSSIEAGIATADHAKLKPLLEELADLISPETAGQRRSQNPLLIERWTLRISQWPSRGRLRPDYPPPPLTARRRSSA